MVASHEPIYDSINKIKGCLCVFWGTKAIFAPCKGIQIPESGNFCIWNPESWKFLLVESGILGLGIRNTGVGIRNPTNNSNPESKFH